MEVFDCIFYFEIVNCEKRVLKIEVQLRTKDLGIEHVTFVKTILDFLLNYYRKNEMSFKVANHFKS